MRLDNLVKVGQLKAHVPDAPFQRARPFRWQKILAHVDHVRRYACRLK